MKSKVLLLLINILLLMTGCGQEEKQPVDYIHPMIGAFAPAGSNLKGRECGRTFPGAATPFGLVQLSPDTYTGKDNGNGYSYFNNTIEGFSFTHMSGIGWFGDFGNFLVMPTTGELKTAKGDESAPEKGYRSRFSHDSEIAKAGYYAVTLSDYNIRTELTAAPRSGIIRFTYPENKLSRIQIDLARRVAGTSTEQYVKVVDDNTICGWMKCPPEGGGWGNGKGKADYTVYFWCQFSKPLKNYGVWSADIPDDWVRKRDEVNAEEYQALVANAQVIYDQKETKGEHLGFFTEFETTDKEPVILKSGISFVSIEGAKENLEHDIPDWDFDQVVAQNRKLWSDAMANVKVEGKNEDDKIKFYTAMYRTMIDPRCYSDLNGNYIGADNKVHQADRFVYRTIFSGWDVFRSQFPLQTIINPEMVNDEINSLLQMADLSGRKYLPRWEIVNSYSGCMLGNPAVPVIVDAYEKGIRNYDIEKAFQYCKNSVDTFSNGSQGFTSESLSKTLEYAYTDWCTGRFAESLGKKDVADEYYQKGQAYKNVWNDEVKWFRTRIDKDNWMKWKGKTAHGQGCKESNPFQQGWFVPHDISGMIELMGEEYFTEKLTEFFENTPDSIRWNDYYNHANEPVHHVPFIFNEIGKPWLTQKWTRKICNDAYGTDVFGLCGNEDVGQMSAWYVLAAAGIHPICPGDNKYQITSPVFDKVEISLDQNYYSGAKFTVLADNNSAENIYIQSMKLNGKPLNRYWITHQEIVAGGVLELEMGPKPNSIN
ncbi:GH92 family glycosyl hydrolase [Sunxiuqinia sp. A32]|uniref:GH92 family glycosyl hydrolase n=1 Tax=Sunxiuqinia sp. A32 TaxID=3461496 RepID=UPI0040458078